VLGILRAGYDERIVGARLDPPSGPRVRPKYVAWSNHMRPEANLARVEQAAAARRGDEPTTRLDPTWREKLEDVLWSMLNAPESTHIM
jgi:hypothetical protein